MCLAVPGMVKELLGDNQAMVDFMGLAKQASLDLVEDIRIGDYVIVHAGFVINKLNSKEAHETIQYLKRLQPDIG